MESLPPATDRYHVTWDPAARTAAITEGRAVLERLECTRCHVIGDPEAEPEVALAPAGRSAHCISCHHWMEGLAPGDHTYATLVERYGEATLERYQRNIEHYQVVPDLTLVARRIEELDEAASEFAGRRMDKSIREALAGRRLDDVEREGR